MTGLQWICVALSAANASAQNPPDVTFTLAAKDGRTSFRMGETIALEFQFQSSAPGGHWIVTAADKRTVRTSLYDSFTVEPKENTVDPLRDIPAQMEGGFRSSGPMTLPLAGDIVKLERDVNEWISFRKPGRYRITAETKRVSSAARPPAAFPLRSNTLEIEVVAAEPGWAAGQIKNATAILERGDQPTGIGRSFDTRLEQQTEQAGRVLRFLETPEAARALVRFFESGPQAAQAHLRAGLFGSPYRAEVMSAMEDGFFDPDRSITDYWIGTLIELAVVSDAPPQRPYPANDPEALRRWVDADRARLAQYKPVEIRYFAKLADSIRSKRGQARAVSLETLFRHGPQPPPPSLLSALLENFPDLPPNARQNLLTSEWPRIGSPSLEPLLRSIAQGKSPTRDAALLRLLDLNPEVARTILLGRIQQGDLSVESGTGLRVLMLLPDKTLPELDQALAAALEQGKPAEPLIARYASEAVFGRLQAFYEKQPGMLCGGPILAYFFRVDPVYAASLLAQARKSNPGGCQLYMSPYEDLLISPGLEKAAIDDLASSNPMIERSAQALLAQAGSPAAKQPLWDALELLKLSKPALLDSGLEYGFIEALLKGTGWLLSSEEIDRLAAACISSTGRSQVASERRALLEPVRISVFMAGPVEGTSVGPFLLRSHDQLIAKIGQFPQGTRFRFESTFPGTWYGEKRKNDIRKILTAAGMQLEEPPNR